MKRSRKRAARLQRSRKDHRNGVVAATREFAALDGFVLDKLQRLALVLHLLHLQVTRQFEQHDPRTALLYVPSSVATADKVRAGSISAAMVYLSIESTCGVHKDPLGPPKRVSESGVLRSERMGKLIQRS